MTKPKQLPPGGVQHTEPTTWEDFLGVKAKPKRPAITDEHNRVIDDKGFTSPGQREAYERVRSSRRRV